MFPALFDAFRSAGPVDRATAHSFHAVIVRHLDGDRITAREAHILQRINWGNALDPFAARDPEWLEALKRPLQTSVSEDDAQ
ncbi:hypothetical protein [Streptomyces sp. NPDC007929]|uniref:hypothetical protein n=1 Tax=Streptomyces sp. NPDC007929 TaxID=3364795 RepID=UPI0036EEED70